MLEHLHFVDEGQVIVVWCHAQHEAMLHIQRDLAGVPVLSDQRMQGVCIWHPADQACTHMMTADQHHMQQLHYLR